MNTIIVDDETKAIDLLEYHLTEFFEDFNITGKYTNINDTLLHVLKDTPEVIFLDINMPEGTGIELLEQIKDKNILVIFVTAHTEYAIDAIKLDAFDYLLKPINISELNRVHSKIINHLKSSIPEKMPAKIKIKISNKHYLFEPNEIINISSEGNYTTIFSTTNSPILITKNLKKVETEYFSSLPFFRCHQSHIININHITEYSHCEVSLKNKTIIPVSPKKYEKLTEFAS